MYMTDNKQPDKEEPVQSEDSDVTGKKKKDTKRPSQNRAPRYLITYQEDN